MDPDSWRARWRDGRIGFHQARPTPALVRHADRLPPGRVLVPLCGKSLDLRWLAERGYAVTGVELVADALAAFYAEQNIPVERTEPVIGDVKSPAGRTGPGPVHTDERDQVRFVGGGITGIAADFFALRPKQLGSFDAIFDRAALVALPAEVRPRYAEQLLRFLRPGGRLLLVSFSYDPARMTGPPYAVSDAEVRSLFDAHGKLEQLESREIIDEEPRYRERGLDQLAEAVWILESPS